MFNSSRGDPQDAALPWHGKSTIELGSVLIQRLREYEHVELCLVVEETQAGDWRRATSLTPALHAWSYRRDIPFEGRCEVWGELSGGLHGASADVAGFLNLASWLTLGKPHWMSGVTGDFRLTLSSMSAADYEELAKPGFPLLGFSGPRMVLKEKRSKSMNMADYLAVLEECRQHLDLE